MTEQLGTFHAMVSGPDNREGIKHGTIHAYLNKACRCEPCKKANRDYYRLDNRARSAAMRELRRRHNDEYREILAEVKKEMA